MKTRQDVVRWAEEEPTLGAEKIDSLRIAVAALIFSQGGQILLQFRGPVAIDAVGCVEGIGGSVGPSDDSLEAALKRKMDQEIGIDCRVSAFEFLTCSHLPFESDGQMKDWAVVTFVCELTSGEPVVGEPGRTDGIGWFDLGQLASWHPPERRGVSLTDYEGKTFEADAGISIWVPTVIKAYIQKYGEKPWRSRKNDA